MNKKGQYTEVVKDDVSTFWQPGIQDLTLYLDKGDNFESYEYFLHSGVLRYADKIGKFMNLLRFLSQETQIVLDSSKEEYKLWQKIEMTFNESGGKHA